MINQYSSSLLWSKIVPRDVFASKLVGEKEVKKGGGGKMKNPRDKVSFKHHVLYVFIVHFWLQF